MGFFNDRLIFRIPAITGRCLSVWTLNLAKVYLILGTSEASKERSRSMFYPCHGRLLTRRGRGRWLKPLKTRARLIRPSGLYVTNPYCRGSLCSHYIVGVPMVIGFGDPPGPTSSLLFVPPSLLLRVVSPSSPSRLYVSYASTWNNNMEYSLL